MFKTIVVVFQNTLHMEYSPAFHCTSGLIIMFFVFYMISYYPSLYWFRRLSWMLTLSGLLHHVRDGYRHGLWLWPFSSIDPYPYYIYALLIMFLPHVFKKLIFKDKSYQHDFLPTQNHSSLYQEDKCFKTFLRLFLKYQSNLMVAILIPYQVNLVSKILESCCFNMASYSPHLLVKFS